MEYPRSPSLNWTYYYQGKNMEELRHSLFCTTLELETTRLAAQEEIKKREDQLIHLKDLLCKTISERDEAQEKCQRHFMDKLILFQQLQQQQQNQIQTTPLSGSGVSSIDDETRRGGDSNNGISSSDCEESIVSSPVVDPFTSPSIVQLVQEKPLPEKGKLLQAVIKAGPLLQSLLLAGPLPQWRHPPPPLDSFEIPPAAIPPPPSLPTLNQDSPINMNSNNNNNSCGSFNKKRTLLVYEGSDSSNSSKYQRVLLQ
ncbi:enabled-like protein [Thalictrum thalictroides]|uniref:Enabled-like protein n=1 Tax=Thalictrum thalictroides TaxID=46969 RepID=A0A7J6WFY1_THATH|nr:enabled-like protein [Thalictrum thalictroides]